MPLRRARVSFIIANRIAGRVPIREFRDTRRAPAARRSIIRHLRNRPVDSRMKRSLLPDAVEAYVDATVTGTDVQRRLRAETARLPNAGMQIGADQGALLAC